MICWADSEARNDYCIAIASHWTNTYNNHIEEGIYKEEMMLVSLSGLIIYHGDTKEHRVARKNSSVILHVLSASVVQKFKMEN